MMPKIKQHLPVIFILLITGTLLSYFAYHNEFSEGGADNYWHYYFSKYAPTYPEFFLHHWGKPLFILLSTGFAHFGFYSLKLFNILCGILAAIVTYRFALKLNLKHHWTAVILLLFTPLYFMALQSGLTEPLMSLVLITSFYLLYSEKYFWAAIIMSFSMYARTEGTFLTVYVLIYLALVRQWKYIPLLGTGFIIYSLIGFFSGHEFLWFFTENPYNMISPYGHGEWGDFFKKYDVIWGIPQTILLSLSLILLIVLGLKKIKQLNFKKLIYEHKIIILIAFPAIILFMFHVIVWKYGLCGSCGLERVVASVAPMFALISAFGLNYFVSEKLFSKIALPVLILVLASVVLYNFKKNRYPLKAYGDNKVELEVSKWFKENYDQNCVIYYAHPDVVFHCDRDPLDKEKNIEQFGLNPDSIPSHNLPTYIFWDSQFSEFSCGLKLDALKNSKKVKLIYGPIEHMGFSVYVFEVIRKQIVI